jgi:hypothetical protein
MHLLHLFNFSNLLPHCHHFPEMPCLWAKMGGSRVAAGGSKIGKTIFYLIKKHRFVF